MMVRFVDSQWLDDATLGSVLVNVTSQDTTGELEESGEVIVRLGLPAA